MEVVNNGYRVCVCRRSEDANFYFNKDVLLLLHTIYTYTSLFTHRQTTHTRFWLLNNTYIDEEGRINTMNASTTKKKEVYKKKVEIYHHNNHHSKRATGVDQLVVLFFFILYISLISTSCFSLSSSSSSSFPLCRSYPIVLPYASRSS